MGRTACTEPQCLYKGALYRYLHQDKYNPLCSESFFQSVFKYSFTKVYSPHNIPVHTEKEEVSCYLLKPSTLEGLATMPRSHNPHERTGTHCPGGWVGPRIGLEWHRKPRAHRASTTKPSST